MVTVWLVECWNRQRWPLDSLGWFLPLERAVYLLWPRSTTIAITHFAFGGVLCSFTTVDTLRSTTASAHQASRDQLLKVQPPNPVPPLPSPEYRLEFIQVITRHGLRTPLSNHFENVRPYNGNHSDLWHTHTHTHTHTHILSLPISLSLSLSLWVCVCVSLRALARERNV